MLDAGIACLAVALMIYVGMLPGAFRVERAVEIATSTPQRVIRAPQFRKLFAVHSIAEFTPSPPATATAVPRAMSGTRPFLHEPSGTSFGIDRMVGRAFAKGQPNLEAQVEA